MHIIHQPATITVKLMCFEASQLVQVYQSILSYLFLFHS